MTVDYEALRRAVDISAVAEWLGLEMKAANNQLRCECPKTGGGPRALVVTPARDQFYCWSPRCKTGGGSLELIAHVHGISLKEAALALHSHLYPAKTFEELPYLLPEHEAVQALGIPAHQAKALGVGYAPRGTMIKHVLIPIRDMKGKLCGYVGIAESGQVKLPKTLHV
jgi:hypothetical protein